MRSRRSTASSEKQSLLTASRRTGSAPAAVVAVSDGDGFSPLNDSSRLAKRNDLVRYFGDEKRAVIMRQIVWTLIAKRREALNPGEPGYDSEKKLLDRMHKSTFMAGDALYEEFMKPYKMTWAEDDSLKIKMVKDAYDVVCYKRLSSPARLVRILWIICSWGGRVPKAWAMLSNSSYTVAITIVTSYLIQSQTEAQNLLNGRESYIQAESFVHNAFQMGLLVLGMLVAVDTIDYLTYAWKSHGRIIREARFECLMNERMRHNKRSPDNTLDYNTRCDPDWADAYFTLREEMNDRRSSSMFHRLYELLTLEVDEDLIFKKVVLPELISI